MIKKTVSLLMVDDEVNFIDLKNHIFKNLIKI